MSLSKTVFLLGTPILSSLSFIMLNAFQSLAFSVQPLSNDTTGFKNVIGEYQSFVQKEGIGIGNPGLVKLDPSKLTLAAAHEVKVFFLNEGASKLNDLTFSATGFPPTTGTVFEKISCKVGCEISEANGNLNIGDWVNLGLFNAGTTLDFKLLAKGKNGATDTYGAKAQDNPDGLDHLVAYQYKDRVILGFEDLFGPLKETDGRNEGSDRDFNDVVAVVDLPVAQAAAVPEPTTMAGLALAGGGLGFFKRRMKRQAARA